jgi:signal transduction histidine kinase
VSAHPVPVPVPSELTHVLGLLPDAHLLTDLDGTVRFANPGARRLVEVVVGGRLAEVVTDPAELAASLGRWGRSADLRPGMLELVDGRRLRADGARVQGRALLLLRLRPHEQASAAFARVTERLETANLRELSRRFEATVHELRAANLRLAAANDEVQQYARAVAHDVRTPLFTIQGFAQLLAEDGHVDEVGGEHVRFILDSTSRLQQTTDALLEVARLGRQTSPTNVRTDARRAVDAVLADLTGELRAAEVQVEVHDLPDVAVDGAALRRVLQNLVVNAVRHAPVADRPLRIEVTGRKEGETATIAVRDDGVGVPEGDRERLFELFHRGVDALDTPGTGIGLAACRKIVAAWGGSIHCEPADGPGTRFVFTAPVPTAGAA